jgi:hypothetical protein
MSKTENHRDQSLPSGAGRADLRPELRGRLTNGRGGGDSLDLPTPDQESQAHANC